MRIILPYTRDHPEHLQSISQFARTAESYPVTGPKAYWELLDWCWSMKQDFMVIEHDIQLRPGVVAEMRSCPELWCTVPFLGPEEVLLTKSLGCTRFRKKLMYELPDLLQEVLKMEDSEEFLPYDFRVLDRKIATILERSHSPHVHEQKVRHLHHYE